MITNAARRTYDKGPKNKLENHEHCDCSHALLGRLVFKFKFKVSEFAVSTSEE